MGFLLKLWDETLAGPPPETGLGKLRKHDSFSATRSPPMVIPHDDHQVPVTRSITILRTSSHLKNLSADSGSAPGSPSGSSTPGTPHSPGTPGFDFRKNTKKKSSAKKLHRADSSPTAYDWIVINALDRWEKKWQFCFKYQQQRTLYIRIFKESFIVIYIWSIIKIKWFTWRMVSQGPNSFGVS